VRAGIKTGYRRLRQAIEDAAPAWAARSVGGLLDRFDLYVVDHGVFRALYPNRWRIGGEMWRMAQPSPSQIRDAARRGIRTIINLRGPRDCGSYRLQREACAAAGITLIDFSVKSRGAPDPATIFAARDLFAGIEYPALMHCKSGADRAGLMSALYVIWREGRPVAEAAQQLSLRYGHIRSADTGVLDHVFALYERDNARSPIDFATWVAERYDHKEAERTFRAGGWANLLVNRLLRRE
jgi:protein tyrosine/serine phosphatase